MAMLLQNFSSQNISDRLIDLILFDKTNFLLPKLLLHNAKPHPFSPAHNIFRQYNMAQAQHIAAGFQLI